ncbi:MAG: hypothetical protein ABI415_04415 [Flavitalea sp.]
MRPAIHGICRIKKPGLDKHRSWEVEAEPTAIPFLPAGRVHFS